jgi:hypothetical protein
MTVSGLIRGLLFSSALLAVASTGCVDDKGELPKGEVDESNPPGTPFDLETGKADGGNSFSISLESAHPYANNLSRDYALNLDGIVPSCATAARVHFAALRTEAGYDKLTVRSSAGATISTFDGIRDGVWSASVPLTDTGKKVVMRLSTDYSVTDYGFRIDAVEVDTHVMCPASPQIACTPGYFDTTPTPDTCGCRAQTTCAEPGWVEIEHSSGGGFTGQYTGRRVVGTVAQSFVQPLNEGEATTNVGGVDHDAVQALVTHIIDSGLLDHPVAESDNWTEVLSIRIGTRDVVISRKAGTFNAAEQAIVAELESLFTCDGANAPLTCGEGFACNAESACVEEASCICPAIYQPVCGVDGHTYSNGCAIACTSVASAHDGACGIAGDSCGTMLGLTCQDGFRCRYDVSTFEPPHADAGGSCVAANYCDAPVDCNGLPHVAVPGAWGCDANACAWHAGPAWNAVAGFAFNTAHPYANNQNVWKELYLPAGATKVRLVNAGTFALENGYDKLEVFTWKNGAWVKVKTYTGSVAPALADEFAGQYFYLHFVSDSSVTQRGFDLTAQYAN